MTSTDFTAATLETVRAFGDAFARGDVDAVMDLMTDDCVFESTSPPDGERFEGSSAVRKVWEELFSGTPQAEWVTEELFASGDRATVRWTFRFGDADGGHIRGVDVITVRDGKVSEKLSYVKG